MFHDKLPADENTAINCETSSSQSKKNNGKLRNGAINTQKQLSKEYFVHHITKNANCNYFGGVIGEQFSGVSDKKRGSFWYVCFIV